MNFKHFLFGSGGNKHTIVKNTIWLGLVEASSKLIMFAVTILVVRYLGPEEYGIYNIAFSYVAMFMIFGDLGLSVVTTRDIARNQSEAQKYLANTLGIKVVMSVVLMILIMISLWMFPYSSRVNILILMAGIFSLAQNISSIFNSVFQGIEKMEYVFANRFCYYLGILAATLMVMTFKMTSIQLVVMYSFSTLASIIWISSISNKLGIKVKMEFCPDTWKKITKESLPFLGLTAAGTIFANADTLLVGKFYGSSGAGWYQSAYKILYAFQSINVINYALAPRITALIHQGKHNTLDKLVKVVLSLSLLGLVPLALLISVFSEQIVKLIYGNDYFPAAIVMTYLVWTGVVNYFRNFLSNFLVAMHRQKLFLGSVVIGTIVNLVLNVSILPNNGLEWAGINLLISEIVILVIMAGVLVIKKPRQLSAAGV